MNLLIGAVTATSSTNTTLQAEFIQNYSLFLTDKQLLQKLTERFNPPSSFSRQLVLTIRSAVHKFIAIWVPVHIHHFDEYTILGCLELVQNRPTPNKNMEDILTRALEFTISPFKSSPLIQLWTPDIIFTNLDDEIIAQQLTLIDFQIYSTIHVRELLKVVWSDSKLRYRAVNVRRMIDRQNQLSFWVCFTIVSAKTLKERVKIWTKWINIASVSDIII